MTKDIKLDADDDLAIEYGDLAIDFSEATHIRHLLLSAATHWRHDAMLGVGIYKYVKTANSVFNKEGASRAIQLQLEYDNWQVHEIEIKSIQEIAVNASKID